MAYEFMEFRNNANCIRRGRRVYRKTTQVKGSKVAGRTIDIRSRVYWSVYGGIHRMTSGFLNEATYIDCLSTKAIAYALDMSVHHTSVYSLFFYDYNIAYVACCSLLVIICVPRPHAKITLNLTCKKTEV